MKNRLAWKIGAVVGALMLAIGVTLAVRDWWSANEARDWVAAQGQVVSTEISSVRRNRSGSGDRYDYTPRMTYRYRVAGRDYQSVRIWLADPRTFDSRSEAQAFLAAYPAGRMINLYHDPADPSRSAVLREVGGRLFFPYLFAAIGGAILLLALLTLRRGKA